MDFSDFDATPGDLALPFTDDKYPNLATLYTKYKAQSFRMAMEVTDGSLVFKDEKAYLVNKNGFSQLLFSLNCSLIEQILYLKYFIVPENQTFFQDWLKAIRARAADPLGLQMLFDNVDLSVDEWFSRRAPAVDVQSEAASVQAFHHVSDAASQLLFEMQRNKDK